MIVLGSPWHELCKKVANHIIRENDEVLDDFVYIDCAGVPGYRNEVGDISRGWESNLKWRNFADHLIGSVRYSAELNILTVPRAVDASQMPAWVPAHAIGLHLEKAVSTRGMDSGDVVVTVFVPDGRDPISLTVSLGLAAGMQGDAKLEIPFHNHITNPDPRWGDLVRTAPHELTDAVAALLQDVQVHAPHQLLSWAGIEGDAELVRVRSVVCDGPLVVEANFRANFKVEMAWAGAGCGSGVKIVNGVVSVGACGDGGLVPGAIEGLGSSWGSIFPR
ncbi:hypothetical protein QP027_02725 [Corynebacterium breve]|uniref:Uncharacterized protein n=1 Tax=Corynebacterium breve TaxID=3049799 RepID=A0ABY8VI91_9CORY|nr:hypothetical protein [Corynebacterium breve]WIM68333.1 hypothetical protein QP027_02725 [Corynebacterium breve]